MKKQQLKLERLEGSKFEAFKGNEILNAIQILGGTDTQKTKGSVGGTDTWDKSTGQHDKDYIMDKLA